MIASPSLPSQHPAPPLPEVLTLAIRVTWGAIDLLRAYYRGYSPSGDPLDLGIQTRSDGPVTAADLATNRYILDHLQTHLPTPSFGYLTEESYKDRPHSTPFPQPFVWIIDPLDGTRDFIDRTGEYAIHLALIQDQRPILAIIALPEEEEIYYALRGGGTFRIDRRGTVQPMRVSSRSQPEQMAIVVGRRIWGDRYKALLARFPVQRRVQASSIGYRIVKILRHEADVYLSLSGRSAPKDWDMAAPDLILTEAGGKLTHADGSALRYNQEDVSQWGCLLGSNNTRHSYFCCTATDLLAQDPG
ncbi:MAG: 3'(2'),5'-bisphosphate nucleotidase CysQ [Prochlorothrix sp.]|nr:3'(2'),5'-bisphosphate nucleotidase CysQ [Prochlorothrix sp.]